MRGLTNLSSLNEVDDRPVTCEERLKASEVMLELNRADAEKVRQFQLAYDQAVQDIKILRNEVEALHKAGARNIDAMREFMELIENLDFKVPSARIRFLTDYEHFYLRFDRNGEIKHAYSPEEYNAVIKREWDEVNAG
jgi:hypothetical protein